MTEQEQDAKPVPPPPKEPKKASGPIYCMECNRPIWPIKCCPCCNVDWKSITGEP